MGVGAWILTGEGTKASPSPLLLVMSLIWGCMGLFVRKFSQLLHPNKAVKIQCHENKDEIR